MPDPGLMTKKMRDYMEAMSPAARTMLLRAMRNAQERGEIDVSTQAIIKAVAALDGGVGPAKMDAVRVKSATPTAPWDTQLRQAFFMPAQPFITDAVYVNKLAARIQRKSLDDIWMFLIRDLAPAEFATALALGGTNPLPDAVQVARKLRRELMPRIAALLQSGDSASKPIRRLVARLGSEMALPDLTDLVYIFQKEGAFLNLSGQLPRILSAFELADPGPVSELARKAIDQLQVDPTFVAVLIMQRCASPVGIASLAMTLAGTSDPRQLAASAYAKMVEAVISEAQLFVHRFENHLVDRPNRIAALDDLRDYHDLVRQLELNLQPTQVTSWHRRLGSARKEMSDFIAREIEPLPGFIRRALRVESSTGGFSGQFDAMTAEDAEFSMRLLTETRNALDSLALNEIVTKLRRPVEQTIEVVTSKLMADLKSGVGADQPDMLKAVDAAIRISAVAFGEEYAALLRKSRDNAVNRPAKTG